MKVNDTSTNSNYYRRQRRLGAPESSVRKIARTQAVPGEVLKVLFSRRSLKIASRPRLDSTSNGRNGHEPHTQLTVLTPASLQSMLTQARHAHPARPFAHSPRTGRRAGSCIRAPRVTAFKSALLKVPKNRFGRCAALKVRLRLEF